MYYSLYLFIFNWIKYLPVCQLKSFFVGIENVTYIYSPIRSLTVAIQLAISSLPAWEQ